MDPISNFTFALPFKNSFNQQFNSAYLDAWPCRSSAIDFVTMHLWMDNWGLTKDGSAGAGP